MNGAHLHLLINHLAVLGIAFGTGLGCVGLLLRKPDLTRAALVVFVLAGAATMVTYYSGEAAEEMVEHASGVSEAALESHEHAAKPATIAGVLLGVAALIALASTRDREPGRMLMAAVLLAALGVTGWNANVANLGGRIRHPEIHAGWTAEPSAGAGQEPNGAREEESVPGAVREGREEAEERAE